MMFDHVLMTSFQLGVLFPVLPASTHSSSFTVSTSMFSKEVDRLCQFLGNLVITDLVNVVLSLVEDLDLGGHVSGGLLVSALSTRALVSVFTSTFL